jgi:hypothetical protein
MLMDNHAWHGKRSASAGNALGKCSRIMGSKPVAIDSTSNPRKKKLFVEEMLTSFSCAPVRLLVWGNTYCCPYCCTQVEMEVTDCLFQQNYGGKD